MDVTVVTAFYAIPSKFQIARYLEWASHFLQMKAPIVLFTDANYAPLFEALRYGRVLNVGGPLQIVVKPFQELDAWKLYGDRWIAEHSKDHEREYHSPQLYALWAQKAWFVKEAIERNPFNTQRFFWCDIGAFRQGPPHPLFPRAEHLPTDRILMSSIQPLTHEDRMRRDEQDFSKVNRIVGGLWGGGTTGCLRWQRAFQSMLERYLAEGRFAGKDQSVMLSAYLADPSLATVVRCTRPEKDAWFFLEDLVAGEAVYELDWSYQFTGPRPIVSVSLKGGLGNQMFQIATACAYAKRTGAELRLLRKKPQPDSRPAMYWDSVLSKWNAHIVDTLPSLPVLCEKVATQCMQLPSLPETGLYLEGYWQSAKYFQGAEDVIRQKMSASPEQVGAVQKKWGWILEAKDRVVLVHARRTDYIPAAAFHGPLTANYYKQASEKMLEYVENPIFLLVSDDPQFWSEIRSAVPAFQKYDTIQLQTPNDVETLTLLQQLQYFIIANSSFSWWGAWLAGSDARVIAPTKWFGPTGPKPHEYDDIYEPHWIRV